ncbi:unnamed protein product [Gongylonema pulchrum]|uniref:Pecanex-like protein n=1 Tax=Gongylonema pulchrum TaxID=637853 RepID=A0A183E992_9BILA|nr:unnamed protein product [Gongylonema pulchrum]
MAGNSADDGDGGSGDERKTSDLDCLFIQKMMEMSAYTEGRSSDEWLVEIGNDHTEFADLKSITAHQFVCCG